MRHCSYEVVQTVHGQLCELIAEHKASRDPEPLLVTKGQMESVLESCGLEKSRVEQFGQEFDREFGPDTPLPPGNIVDARQLEVHTPDVTIRVNPERRDLVGNPGHRRGQIHPDPCGRHGGGQRRQHPHPRMSRHIRAGSSGTAQELLKRRLPADWPAAD